MGIPMSEEEYKDLLTLLNQWTTEEYVDYVAGEIDPEEFITGMDKMELKEMGIQW